MKKTLIFLLVFTFIFLAGNFRLALADELQDGLFRYKAGEYNTAYKLLSPLAVNGNALAQLVLGIMCQEGQGVAQDYKEAV